MLANNEHFVILLIGINRLTKLVFGYIGKEL